MQLFGKTYTRADLEKRVGNISQLGGVRRCMLNEGPAKGVDAFQCRTGAGLDFRVLPDRAMDISHTSFNGCSLVYHTFNDEVSSVYYQSHGLEWLHTFFAGLLTTCGLTYLGPPGSDQGEELGLHGRIANTPATQVCDLSGWDGDEYIICLKGTVSEGRLYGDKLCMERTITSKLGENRLVIHDEVTNRGFASSPFTILYHINAGFPLLDNGAELFTSCERMEPYFRADAEALDQATKFTAPQVGITEQNFLHHMKADKDGYAYAALINRELMDGLGLYLKFHTGSLPYLNEWKMMGAGDYVVGIEPVNVPVKNRAVLREQGNLPFIEPGEVKSMEVEIGVLGGRAAIGEFTERIDAIG